MTSFNEVVAELIDLLENGPTSDARSGAALGLGRAGGPAALAALRDAMKNAPTGAERGAAAAAIGEIIGRGQPTDFSG